MLSDLPKYIIYNSKTGAEQHEHNGYKASKRVLIPNGFDTELFQPSMKAYNSVRKELDINPKATVIGLVGRYHYLKGHNNFLKAASILIKKYPGIQFVLVGSQIDRDNAELHEKIGQLGLSQNVHLLGERFDIPRLTAAFDIATSSSISEGFPNVIGEAMSCAVPCVVTDVGDSAWVIADSGRVVAAQNPEALVAAWVDLLEMGKEMRLVLGRQARRRIMDNFSISAVVKQYEVLYDNVLRNKKLNSCAA